MYRSLHSSKKQVLSSFRWKIQKLFSRSHILSEGLSRYLPITNWVKTAPNTEICLYLYTLKSHLYGMQVSRTQSSGGSQRATLHCMSLSKPTCMHFNPAEYTCIYFHFSAHHHCCCDSSFVDSELLLSFGCLLAGKAHEKTAPRHW